MAESTIPNRVMPSLSFERGTLVLRSADALPLMDWMPQIAWVWDARSGVWRTEALHYRSVVAALRSQIPGLLNYVPAWERVTWSEQSLLELRSEQRAAVEAWMVTRQGVVEMPTGTGKTEVALSVIAQSAVATLVISPVRDLMYQWHRRLLQRLHVDAGVIGDSIYRVLPISVTTYDSACVHMERLGNQFALIIFDECHHLPGAMRSDAARMSAAPFRLGLTATLERADGRHQDLVQLIGATVYSLPMSAVRGRTLADYDIVRIPVQLTDDEQQRYDSLSQRLRAYVAQRRQDDPRFTWEKLCQETAQTPESRRALQDYRAKKAIEERAAEKLRVLEDIFRLHPGLPTIVFAGSNAMARDVSRRFLIPCLLNHCRKKERLDILTGLGDGTYPAVVANQVLDEGVDIPAVKIAVVIGGSGSSRQARQRLGRVLRKQGTQRAVLYEVVCESTTEVKRSRKRRSADAFQGTRHRQL